MRILKTTLKLLKWIITGAIWTYIYINGTLILFRSVWGFNYLSVKSWSVLKSYWNNGGAISTGKDYLLVLCLIALVPLWIWGWKKIYRANYVALLLAPILGYQKRKANNALKNMSRIKIHNIGTSVGEEIKQDFENKLKKRQADVTNAPKASQKLRLQLKDKLRHE